MARQKRIEPFFLVIVDDDQGTFSVEGPMTDDTPWVDAICRTQTAGRNVRCFTSDSESSEEVTAEIQATFGWKLKDRGTII